jgi:hypothetical protein
MEHLSTALYRQFFRTQNICGRVLKVLAFALCDNVLFIFHDVDKQAANFLIFLRLFEPRLPEQLAERSAYRTCSLLQLERYLKCLFFYYGRRNRYTILGNMARM